MVLNIDFDNMDKYKSCYIPQNVDIEKYDVIELFLNKAMIRTPSGYLDVSLKPKQYETIFLRIFIYAIIDYYDITKKTDIDYVKFKTYVGVKENYTRYLPLIYLYWTLINNEKKKNNSIDISNEVIEELMKSNLQQFSVGENFDYNNYITSYFNPKKFKYTFRIGENVLEILNGFIFTTYDISSNSGKKIEELETMNNKKVTRVIKLNRNFFRLREKIVNYNWLI